MTKAAIRNSVRSTCKKASRPRWTGDELKRLKRLEEAIRQCQHDTSSTSIPRLSTCFLQTAIRRPSATCASPKFQLKQKVSRRSSLPQLQEAISMTFGSRRKSAKKPRRNAFVIRPSTNPQSEKLPSLESVILFDGSSSTEERSSTFSLGNSDHYVNDWRLPSIDSTQTQVINEAIHILKDGFSDLHLGDGK
jgi:hypothetical protein